MTYRAQLFLAATTFAWSCGSNPSTFLKTPIVKAAPDKPCAVLSQARTAHEIAHLRRTACCQPKRQPEGTIDEGRVGVLECCEMATFKEWSTLNAVAAQRKKNPQCAAPDRCPDAAHGDGSVSGTVKDFTTGEPLAGVTVVLTSVSICGTISELTDGGGRFILENLSDGSYGVTFFYSDLSVRLRAVVKDGAHPVLNARIHTENDGAVEL